MASAVTWSTSPSEESNVMSNDPLLPDAVMFVGTPTSVKAFRRAVVSAMPVIANGSAFVSW